MRISLVRLLGLSRQFSTRSSWLFSIADQGLYSASNIVLTISVSTLAGLEQLGRLTTVLVGLQFAQRLTRYVLGDIAQLTVGDGHPIYPSLQRAGIVVSCGAAALGGLSLALGLGPSPADELRWLSPFGGAFIFGAVLWQDTRRTAALVNRRYRRLLSGDAIWVGIMLAAWAALARAALSPPAMAAALATIWGLAAALAGSVISPNPRSPTYSRKHSSNGSKTYFLQELRSQGPSLAYESIQTLLLPVIIVWPLTILAGSKAVGEYRLAEAVFGILPIIFTGLRSVLVRDLRSTLLESGREALRYELHRALLAVLVVSTVAVAALLWASGTPAGRAIGLGGVAGTLLIILGLDRMLTGLLVILQASVRAAGNAARTSRIQWLSLLTGSGLVATLSSPLGATGAGLALLASRSLAVLGYRTLSNLPPADLGHHAD